MKLKFCGIRCENDIDYINEFSPDYIGYIFAPSKRLITPESAGKLNRKKKESILSVGVFVNAPLEEMLRTIRVSGIDIIQLHGDEDKKYISELKKYTRCEIWKAVRVKKKEDILNAQMLGTDKLILDSFSQAAYGGTGICADWSIIKSTDIKMPFFIAGGINQNNILSAVSELQPYGADISGGIETDGAKDRGKIKRIIELLERNR